MAHLLPEEAQEEIHNAGDEADRQEVETEAELEALTSPLPLPSEAPSTEAQLMYRLGAMEATLATILSRLEAEQIATAEQEQQISELEAQTEIQEEMIVEQQEEEKPEPTFWETLFGGSRKR